MRVIHVDPATHSVAELDIGKGYKELQKLTRGCFQIIYPGDYNPVFANEDGYVNEEGRMDPEMARQRWSLRGWPERWLCGPAVFLRATRGGDSAPSQLTVKQVREQIVFLDAPAEQPPLAYQPG